MTPLAFAESLIAAFAASDKERYFAHFHPDATFLFHDTPGLIGSRAVYEGMWDAWVAEAGFQVLECESSDARVDQHGDLATFTHRVRTVRLIDGERSEVFERESIVLHREGGAWTCVHEHLSPDPAHAEA